MGLEGKNSAEKCGIDVKGNNKMKVELIFIQTYQSKTNFLFFYISGITNMQ